MFYYICKFFFQEVRHYNDILHRYKNIYTTEVFKKNYSTKHICFNSISLWLH